MTMTTTEAAVAPLTIRLFGPLFVLVEGWPLPHLRSRKAQWLLALLTLRHGRPVEREWLAGTLWPDMDQSQAFDNLRPVLSELRKALGSEGERLQSPNRHALILDLAGTDVDVLAFDAAIASKTPLALERAAALYKGPLLEGCAEEWVTQERSERERNCLWALQTLADAALTAGDYGAAADYYRRAANLNLWGDEARRGLMEALDRGGDRNAAIQVYREFVELLRSDPRVTPDEKTRALYTRLRDEARRRVSATPVPREEAKAAPKVVGYLPHPLTELIGREDERLEVAARLRRSRLVTLTGSGGIGKTRLAIAVAAEVVAGYADGVWLVSLEALSEDGQVVEQIAAVLGVKEEPNRPLLQTLTDHLRRKRLLLVLDNCEHLVEASAHAVGHLLRECAGVRVLATSRAALGITGETAWAVPSLAVPELTHLPEGNATRLRVLMSYESVQLFVERAQAAHKSFTLTGSAAQTVAEICSYLEGIPLAIELAAVRVKSLTIEQIAARLHDHLGLIMGRSPMTSSRQQTLRTTVDWSYTLLNEPERLVLQRLSVFVGGWSLEAAESVCTGGGIAGPQILDVLTSLTEKSLIAFEERDTEIGGRYWSLEMVRQYAAERLEAGGEIEPSRARHRRWLMALVEEAEPLLKAGAQEKSLRRLDAERDNLHATLLWDGADATADLRLTGALYQYWYVRGYWSEGRERLSLALGREAAQTRTAERAKSLDGAGVLAYSQGDYASARSLHEESLSIRRELGNREGIASSLNSLGKVSYDQGDFASARALHEESLSLWRELGDKQGVAWSLNSLGNIAHPQGDYALAQTLYEESLRLLKELGDKQGVGRTLSGLGYVAYDQGDFVSARTLYEESLAIFQELGDQGGIAWALCCLGYTSYDQGDYVEAKASLTEGMNLFRELEDKRGVAWAVNSLGNVAHQQGDYASAQTLHEESLGIRRQLGDKQGMAWSFYCLGNVSYSKSDFAAARVSLAASLRLFRELADRKGMAENLKETAAVLLAQSETRNAARLWGASQSLRESIGSPMAPLEKVRHEGLLEQARLSLGENAFAAAWDKGCSLTWEQAAAVALGEQPDEAHRNDFPAE